MTQTDIKKGREEGDLVEAKEPQGEAMASENTVTQMGQHWGERVTDGEIEDKTSI